MAKHWPLPLLVASYWLLHQDFWNWRLARPLTLGFLPPGLTYHALYTLGVAALMALLVRYAWPAGLERRAEASTIDSKTGSRN